jgi:hypothetical protein
MNEGTCSGKSTIRLLGIRAERPTNGLYLLPLYETNQEKSNILGLLLSAGNESQDYYNHPFSTQYNCASLIIGKIYRNQDFTFSLF